MRTRHAAAWLLCGLLAAGAAAAQGADGEALYRKYCSQCHGEKGDGKGIAEPYLNPAPRDFTAAKFKVRSTPTGALPTDGDLERVIRGGLPYTGMPAFAQLGDAQVAALVAYVKTFSSDFEDPEAHAPPIEIPAPPPWSAASAEQGRDVYVNTGCIRCHGDQGRSDGPSAPTLTDDQGRFIRPADLTKPWTFRGGGTRRDIFRTMSTGFNGTPMPGFGDAMSVEDRWHLVDYITSLSGNRTAAPYATFVHAVPAAGELDLARGRELFAAAPPALFPIIGQVMEPGRDFAPSVNAVEVRAVYDSSDIAFLVTWHDLRADTGGHNAPDLQVPEGEELLESPPVTPPAGEEEGGFWGEAAADEGDGGGGSAEDFWGEAAAPPPPPDAAGGDGGFWDTATEPATPAAGPASEFSDAVALQFPATLPQGIRKPYFLFGDPQNPVELWYVDLADPRGQLWSGRGRGAVTVADGEAPEVTASFDAGEWTVAMKRRREVPGGLSFPYDRFVPIAFSVWDGFHRERGARRGVSAWFDVYVEPRHRPSPAAPMARAGFGILALELLLIVLVRRRYGRGKDRGGSPTQSG